MNGPTNNLIVFDTNQAISIRRFGKPRPKLPDAIVAATAVVLGATLASEDDKLLKLKWDGYSVYSIK
jgi:predicted nucleic acid-binding protein